MADPKGKEFFFTLVSDPYILGEEVITNRPMLGRTCHWEPRTDVVEEPHRLLITCELAGLSADEISLSFTPETNSLWIKGSRMESNGKGKRIAHQLEISYGTFEREVELPDFDLDGQNISAQYRNGFLFVSIPKSSPL